MMKARPVPEAVCSSLSHHIFHIVKTNRAPNEPKFKRQPNYESSSVHKQKKLVVIIAYIVEFLLEIADGQFLEDGVEISSVGSHSVAS
jgi:hypothetical protein